MKSYDSLVQQGWPFHMGADMRLRSPWLNGTTPKWLSITRVTPCRLPVISQWALCKDAGEMKLLQLVHGLSSFQSRFTCAFPTVHKRFAHATATHFEATRFHVASAPCPGSSKVSEGEIRNCVFSNSHCGSGGSESPASCSDEQALEVSLCGKSVHKWCLVGNKCVTREWEADVSVHFSSQSLEEDSSGSQARRGQIIGLPLSC